MTQGLLAESLGRYTGCGSGSAGQARCLTLKFIGTCIGPRPGYDMSANSSVPNRNKFKLVMCHVKDKVTHEGHLVPAGLTSSSSSRKSDATGLE